MPPSRSDDGRSRPTLATIAAAGDVSVPTVSKVLNGRPDVSDDTRRRIELLLREHRYVAPASRGAAVRSRTVCLLFHDVTNAFSTEIIRGATDGGWEHGVDVVVGRIGNQDAIYRERTRDSWGTRMKRAGHEGVVLVTPSATKELAAFHQAGLPVVLIDPLNVIHDDAPSVGATNWNGGRSATKHLIELGHQRIAFVGGPFKAACSQARLHGHQAALEEAGLSLLPHLTRHGDFHYATAYRLGMELLDRPKPPTAVFAASDETAVGLMQGAYALGCRVPDDLSVVGFDDTFVARWATPPLTTVRAPLQEMGRLALRMLLQLIDGEDLDSHHIQLATRLVVRDSTGPPTRTHGTHS